MIFIIERSCYYNRRMAHIRQGKGRRNKVPKSKIELVD